MTVRLSEFKHDQVVLNVQTPIRSPLTPFVTGLPVKVTWAGGPTGGDFFGYVDKVAPPYKKPGARVDQTFATITCVGMTYPLKSEGLQIYTDYSVDAAIKDAVKRFKLSARVQEHSVQWPSLSQGGRSWWEFIVDMAKNVGYSLFPAGSGVTAVDRHQALSMSPHFRYDVVPHPTEYYHPLEFEPVASSGDGIGDARPGEYTVHGVSRFSGSAFEMSKATVPATGASQSFETQFERVVPVTPRTIAEASAYLEGAHAAHQFTQRARMTVLGNPNIGVGSGIDVRIRDGNQLFDGTWYVVDVEHRIGFKNYITLVEMISDGGGYPLVLPPPGLAFKGRQPATVYRNKQWIAEWSTS